MTINKKSVVIEIAHDLGFHHVAIGSMQPLKDQEDRYSSWIENGFAASMHYMQKNLDRRMQPGYFFEGSKSAVLASVSYYSERPSIRPFHGAVARYAVGLDYHAVFRKKMRELRDRIAVELNCSVLGKPFIDSYPFFEQAYADRHGLGFIGKNSLLIMPELAGSYSFIGELFLDIELEADGPYVGTCGKCFRCGVDCPTQAIVEPGVVDSNRCISYLTIENRDGVPLELRQSMGDWVFGCDVCQEVCPYNQRPVKTPWVEFEPQSGAGHYLDLVDLLAIDSDELFQQRFGSTALRRPRRRGLLRNALVVLGNQFAEIVSGSTRWPEVDSSELEAVKRAVFDFAWVADDEMLREHAAWAIFRSGDAALLSSLEKREKNPDLKDCLRKYLFELD